METIFDHNVTGIELEVLSSFMPNKAIGKGRIIYKKPMERKVVPIYIIYMF